MISLLLFLARLCGKLIGMLARTQTRLLTRAQNLGWMPNAAEAGKLLVRQSELFKFEMARAELRKRKL